MAWAYRRCAIAPLQDGIHRLEPIHRVFRKRSIAITVSLSAVRPLFEEEHDSREGTLPTEEQAMLHTTIDDLRNREPEVDLGTTEWQTIEQARIDEFAHATGDEQWIHVDVDRAAQGPYGATIAHGYLTLSLLSPLL